MRNVQFLLCMSTRYVCPRTKSNSSQLLCVMFEIYVLCVKMTGLGSECNLTIIGTIPCLWFFRKPLKVPLCMSTIKNTRHTQVYKPGSGINTQLQLFQMFMLSLNILIYLTFNLNLIQIDRHLVLLYSALCMSTAISPKSGFTDVAHQNMSYFSNKVLYCHEFFYISLVTFL